MEYLAIDSVVSLARVDSEELRGYNVELIIEVIDRTRTNIQLGMIRGGKQIHQFVRHYVELSLPDDINDYEVDIYLIQHVRLVLLNLNRE